MPTPEHTADQILEGISGALKADDMPAAASLIHYLATVDPVAAALIVETVRTGHFPGDDMR